METQDTVLAGPYYGVSESPVGHPILWVAYLVSFVRNGWRTNGNAGHSHGGQRPLKCKHRDTAVPEPRYSL